MNKQFDCVAMKEQIQRGLQAELEGLLPEQQRKQILLSLKGSRSPVGDLWRALERRSSESASRVAEADGRYGGKG